jgi:RecB family exonuclease
MIKDCHMQSFRVFRLSIDDPRKEQFLLNQLCKDCFSSGSSLDHAREQQQIIYVANSANKIRRLRRQIARSAYASSSPTFVTIKPFFRYLYELLPSRLRAPMRVITESHARVILRHLLIDKRGLLFPGSGFSLSAETADFFLTWIRNIKEYDLNITFGSNTIAYRKTSRSFDISKRENKYNQRLLETLASVFDLYQEFLARNELIDESDREWWIIDHLQKDMLADRTFYIEHLSILRTVEQSIFKLVFQYARSVTLLDLSYPFWHKRFTTTGIVPQNSDIHDVSPDEQSAPGMISVRVFQKREHEIEALAQRIAAEESEGQIAIIAPNLDECESPIERFFPRYSLAPPFKVRRRLAEFPIIKTCLSLFEIITGNYGRRAVVSFLRSPMVSFLDEEEKANADRMSRDRMIASGNDWQRLTEGEPVLLHIAAFINELRTLTKEKGMQFLSHYMHLLETIIVEGADSRPMNRYMRYLSSLTREPLASAIAPFSMFDFQRILCSYAETARITEEKPYDERVTLLKLEEAGAMNFDRVFLIGLVEGNIPQSPQSKPLFSEKLLEEMGFPTYDLVYDLSKFNFQSILASSRHAYCSYYEKDEQGNVYLLSPFLRMIETSDEEPYEEAIHTLRDWQVGIGENLNKGSAIREESLNGDLLQRAELIREGIERFKDEGRLQNVKEVLESSELNRYIKQRISELSRRLSPSALELYQRCPYSYFLRYILRLQEMEEPEEGVDSMIRGSIIHKILARFLERKISKRIESDMKSEWKILQNIAQDCIKEMAPRTRDRILLHLELVLSEEHESLLRRYLLYDSTRHRGHRIEDVEWGFSGQQVTMPAGNGDVLGFHGRIDRIDSTGEGLIIFDYKTGSKTTISTDLEIERGESLQLPLYAYAAECCIGKVARTAYFLISSSDLITVQERKLIPREQLIHTVQELWKKIEGLNFEASPTPYCNYCMFARLCPGKP